MVAGIWKEVFLLVPPYREWIAEFHGYQIGSHGSIHDYFGRKVPQVVGNRGRCFATLRINGVAITQQVAYWMLRAFVGHPPKMFSGEDFHACHEDDDPTNNCLANLNWCSRSTNAAYAARKGKQTSSFNGVSWNDRKSKWITRVKQGYETHFVRYFDREIEAALAFDEYVRSRHDMRDKHRNFPVGIENTGYMDPAFLDTCERDDCRVAALMDRLNEHEAKFGRQF